MRFCLFLYFKLDMESPIPLFKPGSVHIGSASWDDCGRAFPDELRVSSFPWKLPTLCPDRIVNPLRLRWVKGAHLFRCNLPPALLLLWPCFFTCHCSNTWVEQTLITSQLRKLTLEWTNSLATPAGYLVEPSTFRSRVRRCTNWAILARLVVSRQQVNWTHTEKLVNVWLSKTGS